MIDKLGNLLDLSSRPRVQRRTNAPNNAVAALSGVAVDMRRVVARLRDRQRPTVRSEMQALAPARDRDPGLGSALEQPSWLRCDYRGASLDVIVQCGFDTRPSVQMGTHHALP
jgi:hypothetical protein